MPTILTLDGQHYEVPDSVNLNVLVKSLHGLKKLRWNYDRGAGGTDYYVREPEAPAIKIEISDRRIIREPAKAKRIPAKAGPDANRDMGIS